MPNIIVNEIRITPKNKKADKFSNVVKDICDNYFNPREDSFTQNSKVNLEFDFNKLIKMPDDVFIGDLTYKLRELHGNKNWYDWRINNWGCKWNASGSSIGVDYDECVFELRFITATTPPILIAKKFFELFKKDVDIEWRFTDIDNDEDRTFDLGKMLKHKKFSLKTCMKDIRNDNESAVWGFINMLSQSKKSAKKTVFDDEEISARFNMYDTNGNPLSDEEVIEHLDSLDKEDFLDSFRVSSDLIPMEVREGEKSAIN